MLKDCEKKSEAEEKTKLKEELKELRLRNRYGINFVAMQEDDGTINARIDPDRKLTGKDQLLVLGDVRDLGKLKD